MKWFSFAVVIACPVTVWASPSAELSRATRLLGSSQFSERHEAGDLLLKAGPSDIPYPREAAGSDIPEVRFRAQGLRERIELQILDGQKAEILSGAIQRGSIGRSQFSRVAGCLMSADFSDGPFGCARSNGQMTR